VIDEIKERLDDGFKPFAVRLCDGRRFVVPHRDFIALSRRTVVIIDVDELPVSTIRFISSP